MDYYPQPRPVLYGTSEEEAPPQTQTAPVRTGPPRYPPAPPLAGDAPDPFNQPPKWVLPDWVLHRREPGSLPLAIIYAFALLLSLLQAIFGLALFANSLIERIVLVSELIVGLLVVASLRRLDWRRYITAMGLLLIYIPAGVILARWQSPAFWVACIVALYLLRPYMTDRYVRNTHLEIHMGIIRYRFLHPRRQSHRRFGGEKHRL